MEMLNGKLYFKSPDVIAFTGITQGQINAARRRGDLNPYQRAEGGDCYFDVREIMGIQDDIVKCNRVGSAKMRKAPKLKSRFEYNTICKFLRRSSFVPRTWEELYFTVYNTQSYEGAKSTSPVTPSPQPSVVSEGRQVVPPKTAPKGPDMLPFTLALGAEEVPMSQYAKEDFQNVKEACFGYADETNKECKTNCEFFQACAMARFKILKSIALGLEKGLDRETILLREVSILEQEKRKTEKLLNSF